MKTITDRLGPQIAKAAATLPNAPKDLEGYQWVDFGPGGQGPQSHLAFPGDRRGGRPVVFLRRRVNVQGRLYLVGWKSDKRVAGYSELAGVSPRIENR